MNETAPLINPQVSKRRINFGLKSILILTILAYFTYNYIVTPVIKTIKDKNFKSCLGDCVDNTPLCRGNCNAQLEECHKSCPIKDLECNQLCVDYFKLACYSPCEDNKIKCFNKCKADYNMV